jgi:hypothetical protein
MQDKTAGCFWGIGHLLKTFRHYRTQKANKKQILFSPHVRPSSGASRWPSSESVYQKRSTMAQPKILIDPGNQAGDVFSGKGEWPLASPASG